MVRPCFLNFSKQLWQVYLGKRLDFSGRAAKFDFDLLVSYILMVSLLASMMFIKKILEKIHLSSQVLGQP
jgi:hypothetical protein